MDEVAAAPIDAAPTTPETPPLSRRGRRVAARRERLEDRAEARRRRRLGLDAPRAQQSVLEDA